MAQSWQQQLPGMQQVGHGQLSWFGLPIYSAVLWSEHLPMNPNAQFALQLTYHRRISSERFVQISMEEIRRLSAGRFPAPRLQQWEHTLRQVFPDVVEGDQLIGVYLPQHGCRFYNQHVLIADIPDVEMAQAFFSIWLDERSQDRELRAQLLGEKK